MDLNSLSLQELRKLKEKVEREIGKREAAGKKTLLDLKAGASQAQQMARADEGLTMEDLLPSAQKPAAAPAKKGPKQRVAAKPKNSPAPKYAHPEDPSITWTGRGRKPVWALNWINEGKSLDDLLIQK
jgi:DNA-binding protein H-NS